MKNCIACGMPLLKTEDYPMGDVTKNYCRSCAHPDGSMVSYDEKLSAMTEFVVQTLGVDVKEAQSSIKELLAILPAWKEGAVARVETRRHFEEKELLVKAG